LTIRDVRNLSPFVVGPDADQAQYQTIASAVADANATFQPQNILIQAGNYVGEVLPVILTQTIQGIGANTATLFGANITISANGSVVTFENLTFNSPSFAVGNNSTVIFRNCVLIGPGNLASNNASVQFYDTVCQNGFTVNIGTKTVPFLNTDFPIILENSSFGLLTISGNKITRFDNCTVGSFSIASLPTNLPDVPNVIKNSKFNGTISFTGSTPTIDNPLVVTNCTFEGDVVSLSISGGASGHYTLDDCIFMGTNTGLFGFTLGTGIFVNVNHCTFGGIYFSPFVAGTTVQFTHCNFDLVNPLEFQGVQVNNQSLAWCKITQRGSVISNPIVVIANGFLRCSYLTVSVENAGVPLFDIQAGSQMVLLYSNLKCAAANYLSAGTGTLQRPLFGLVGSNLLEGPGGTGGATVSDVIAPFIMV